MKSSLTHFPPAGLRRFLRGALVLFLAFWVVLPALARTGALYTAEAPVAPVAVEHPDWSYQAALYEVNLRQYTPGGTFAEFATHLPRLKEMGVDILWLMPIHPIGEVNRKGSLGSYYSVKDYQTVNPEFGTLEEFRELVRRIHEQDMYVIIDWVANHTAWDNPLATEHPDWFIRDDSGRFVSPVPDWHDVIDLNYESPELREWMIAVMTEWVATTDIDGFRCDVAGMVPADFWRDVRAALDAVKPVLLLAEDEDPAQHAVFDMTYSWELHRLMMDVARRAKPALALRDYFLREGAAYPPEAFRMRFIDNHDENSWNGPVAKRFGPAAPAMAVLTVTAPGMPLLYSGQEAGLDKALAFFERDPIPWRDYPQQEFYTRLLALKQTQPALAAGERGAPIEFVATSDDSTVLAFVRADEFGKVLTVLNFSGKARKIGLAGLLPLGDYVDLFTGQRTPLPVSPSLALEPWGYRVLVE